MRTKSKSSSKRSTPNKHATPKRSPTPKRGQASSRSPGPTGPSAAETKQKAEIARLRSANQTLERRVKDLEDSVAKHKSRLHPKSACQTTKL